MRAKSPVSPGVTNVDTGQAREREGVTDTAGYYSIANVLEGTYDLSIKMAGFRNYLEKGIIVTINTVTRANANLQVGQVNDTVTVEASAAVLQTTKADVAVNLEARAIENLPLGGYRNYQSLINLVPGATPGALQNAVTDTFGRSLTTNVNGQDRGANNTRLDGAADILITMPHHAGRRSRLVHWRWPRRRQDPSAGGDHRVDLHRFADIPP
ncbi:MAG TPA: carboxypeptidase-like regulatory domain-containing protein [Acidobacteriota bacterium]|nr:carboxypeptidase-like regulatory domain-containing protein [Acidobacteriota bacterium]